MPTPTIIPIIVQTENYFAALSDKVDDDDDVTTIKPNKDRSKIAHAAKQNRQTVLNKYENDDDDDVTVVMSNKTSNKEAKNPKGIRTPAHPMTSVQIPPKGPHPVMLVAKPTSTECNFALKYNASITNNKQT